MTDPLYFKQVEVGPMANFVYLIGDQSKRKVFIVDPAWQIDTIFKIAEKDGMEIAGALITHSHYDHCNGVDELLKRKNVPLYVHEEEADFVKSLGKSDSIFGTFPDENLKKVRSGEKVSAGDVEITFIHTPGHTPGSQCFLLQNRLLTGDTLFIRGCGRCDLPGGNPNQMYESLTQKIMKLSDNTELFPGHFYGEMPTASLKEERVKNPYLLCNSIDTFLKMTGS